METAHVNGSVSCHVLAIPYPGRGHVNPLMNLCKLMATTRPNLLITFVVTEEWLGFLESESKPANIGFRTIPNVIPSEKVRAKDFLGFIQAVYTKMEAPVESLLDRLELPEPNAILADSYLPWVVRLGKRRNIPVASFWPMSVTNFSIFHHYQLLIANGHFQANLQEQGEELVNYIPGVASTRVKDLPQVFYSVSREILPLILEAVSMVPKAQYTLFTTIGELESEVIEALKSKFSTPIYKIGPAIPYEEVKIDGQNQPNYFSWLDAQPNNSVLYISQGSFLSVSHEQMKEIIAGVHDSGVRFFWVARDNASLYENEVGNRGIVVPWCEQLRVLCHSSIGGFWSHCGWNSTKEGAFSGVPFLTYPIAADQFTNSKLIVDDWKIGLRVNKEGDEVVKRDEIALLLQMFMDCECLRGREMKRRSVEIQKTCQDAIDSGLIDKNIEDFIRDISSMIV